MFYRGPKVISTTGSEPTMSAKTVSHWTTACQSSRAAWRTTSRNERVISCPGSSSKAILQLAYIIEWLDSRTKIGKKSGFPSVENSCPILYGFGTRKLGGFFLLHCRLFQDWYSKLYYHSHSSLLAVRGQQLGHRHKVNKIAFDDECS